MRPHPSVQEESLELDEETQLDYEEETPKASAKSKSSRRGFSDKADADANYNEESPKSSPKFKSSRHGFSDKPDTSPLVDVTATGIRAGVGQVSRFLCKYVSSSFVWAIPRGVA